VVGDAKRIGWLDSKARRMGVSIKWTAEIDGPHPGFRVMWEGYISEPYLSFREAIDKAMTRDFIDAVNSRPKL
jgi:hypothetical protein